MYVIGIDIHCSSPTALHKHWCLYRPVVSWHKVVVVLVVAEVAVCQTRRVSHPCPYQSHGSMGHHVGWQLPHVDCQDTQDYCLVIMGTTAWGCCQVTGVVAVQTQEFEAAQIENQEVPHLVGAISLILPLMVRDINLFQQSKYCIMIQSYQWYVLWVTYSYVCKVPLMRGLLNFKFTTKFTKLEQNVTRL
jgi:hypothetical protein